MSYTDRHMAKLEPYLLNLAGEYRVCSELNKRGVFATITYGNRKGVDIYVISDTKNRALKVEVKTSQQGRFVTGITQKGLDKSPNAPDFWVFCNIKPSDNGQFSERCFILDNAAICQIQKARNEKYGDEFERRHAKRPDPKRGVDNVIISDVEKYEDRWATIVDRIKVSTG
jgi:hypothetical protein